MFEKKKIFEYFVSWGCFGKEVLVWFLGGAEELQQLLSSEKKKHPDLLFVMYNPISGIHLGSVCFCRPLICCNFTFQYVETLVVRLRNKQHLVRVRRRSCLGLKYLLWLSQTQTAVSPSEWKEWKQLDLMNWLKCLYYTSVAWNDCILFIHVILVRNT